MAASVKYFYFQRTIWNMCTTGAQLGGRGRGEAFPVFLENKKKCLDFGKKALNVSIIWLNLPFQM